MSQNIQICGDLFYLSACQYSLKAFLRFTAIYLYCFIILGQSRAFRNDGKNKNVRFQKLRPGGISYSFVSSCCMMVIVTIIFHHPKINSNLIFMNYGLFLVVGKLRSTDFVAFYKGHPNCLHLAFFIVVSVLKTLINMFREILCQFVQFRKAVLFLAGANIIIWLYLSV